MEKKKWSLHVILFLIATIIVIGIFIYLWRKPTLSTSDSILLTFLSVGISLYWGRYFSYEQALERIEGEATKALRRIVRIKDSTLRLIENCERIMAEIPSNYKKSEQRVLLEYFQGIHARLKDILGNVDSSIDDWGDMLKEKVDALKKAEREQLELYENKLKETDDINEEYKKLLIEATGAERNRLLRELDRKFAQLAGELRSGIAQIREERSPSIPPPSIMYSSATASFLPSSMIGGIGVPLTKAAMAALYGSVEEPTLPKENND